MSTRLLRAWDDRQPCPLIELSSLFWHVRLPGTAFPLIGKHAGILTAGAMSPNQQLSDAFQSGSDIQISCSVKSFVEIGVCVVRE
jgi:hypothetical protein